MFPKGGHSTKYLGVDRTEADMNTINTTNQNYRRTADKSETICTQFIILYTSRVVRKPAFCICENKDADQLRGNREAGQRLCFRYIDSTIPLLPKYESSSL